MNKQAGLGDNDAHHMQDQIVAPVMGLDGAICPQIHEKCRKPEIFAVYGLKVMAFLCLYLSWFN